ncbi:MAG: DUF2934 domain-containing protein [Methylomonas sp.]|jgi:hypothetical protein
MSVAEKKYKETTAAEMPETINPPCDDAKIAEIAYYKAESRGFEPGREFDDWLEAEQELMQNQESGNLSASSESI